MHRETILSCIELVLYLVSLNAYTHSEKLSLITQKEYLHPVELPACQNCNTQSNTYHISIQSTKRLFQLVSSWVVMLQQGLALGNIRPRDYKHCMLSVQDRVLFGLWFYKLHQKVRGLENSCADLFLYHQSIYFHPYDSRGGEYKVKLYKCKI